MPLLRAGMNDKEVAPMTDAGTETKARKSHGIARFLFTTSKDIIQFALVGLLGALLVLVTLFVIHLEKRPALNIWHTAFLDEEFTTHSPVDSFEGYLALEERLFKQLQSDVCHPIPSESKGLLNRFQGGSLSDPGRWPRNWNRTFELEAHNPKGGVLLLHGMSDSPYSLRSIGERLHAEGYWVVGMRLPGHGAAPSGLVHVKWEDMAAAVRIGLRHIKGKVGDHPLHIVGYSNGGALGVHYALSALEDNTLPRVDSLVLISPAIGVAPVAVFAVWQARLGHLLGLPKLEWAAIQPEYDPYKFCSFAVNAGNQVYRLTKEIQARLEKLRARGGTEGLPPILAFQSAVDGTVSTRALVQGLFARLSPSRHELVVFDINRLPEVERILLKDPQPGIEMIQREANLPFAFSLITNEQSERGRMVVRHKNEKSVDSVDHPLELIWPEKVYSLSHIALPFPMDDPLYGTGQNSGNPGIQLGNIALRGERGLLQISATDMLRLRHNPFYPYMEQRLVDFFALAEPQPKAPSSAPDGSFLPGSVLD